MSNYFLRLAIALDQLGNAAIGGEPDESISSRAWRNRDRPWWRGFRQLIDSLFFWQNDHCRGAYEDEQHRRQFPPDLRTPG